MQTIKLSIRVLAGRALKISNRVSIRSLKLSNFERCRTLKLSNRVSFRALKLSKRAMEPVWNNVLHNCNITYYYSCYFNSPVILSSTLPSLWSWQSTHIQIYLEHSSPTPCRKEDARESRKGQGPSGVTLEVTQESSETSFLSEEMRCFGHVVRWGSF